MRKERDSLGEFELPDHAYFGVQTYRAFQNFQISGTRIPEEFIRSYLRLKRAAALANRQVKALDAKRAEVIVHAIDGLLSGDLSKHFIVDAYQAGAGTSQNMNLNEVIANKANETLRKPLGSYDPIHPNDHVNMSQSTNDSYPTAMRLATLALARKLIQEMRLFSRSLQEKASEFSDVLKAARTHLQDAVPITLGQEFEAYAEAVRACAALIASSLEGLRELGIGGSAAGTGMNVPKGYRGAILRELKKSFKDPELRLAPNMCFAMQSQLPMSVYSGALRSSALELTRIFNDLRLLSSGPSNGFAEISLPEAQPGSSIMPGKVNPSLLEMGNQVLFKALGNASAMDFAMQAGQLELNVMMPLMAALALESTGLLTNMLRAVRIRCIDGITADRERCRAYAERTSQVAAALNPVLGYAKSAEIAKEAVKKKRSVLEIVRERNLLSEKQIRRLLDPKKLTKPQDPVA